MRAAVSCVFFLLIVGCASSPDGSRTNELQNLITREQIDDSNEITLYGVIDKYHPAWIQVSRPSGIAVVDDDLERLGIGSVVGLDALKMRGTEGVYALEYLNNIRASSLIRNWWGSAGAIIVRTRPGGAI